MADVHVIGSVWLYIGVKGIKFARTIPTAVVGSVGIKIDSTGVQGTGPPFVTAVVGSVGLQIGSSGVIGSGPPSVTAVIGSVELVVKAEGVSGIGPSPVHQVGSVAIQIAPAGVIGFFAGLPISPLVTAVIGSVGILIGGTGVIESIKPTITAVTGSVGIVIGEFRVPELTVYRSIHPADLILAAITGSVGMEVGGADVPVLAVIKPPVTAVTPPQAIADPMVYIGWKGVIAILYPQVTQVIGDAEIVIGGAPGPAGIFETYVLTGTRGEPSLYSGFNFNSYAKHRGQYFGAGAAGIYLLEGSDDNGAEIHPGVRVGPINFGTDREKRMRLLRCGGSTTGAQVRVSSNGQQDFADVEDGRAGVSRKVQGRELTIEIADFTTLDHLEIVPTILAKR